MNVEEMGGADVVEFGIQTLRLMQNNPWMVTTTMRERNPAALLVAGMAIGAANAANLSTKGAERMVELLIEEFDQPMTYGN